MNDDLTATEQELLREIEGLGEGQQQKGKEAKGSQDVVQKAAQPEKKTEKNMNNGSNMAAILAAKQEMEERAAAKGADHYLTMKEAGSYRLRILPQGADTLPWIEVRKHWINKRPHDCLGPNCPICAKVAALKAATTDAKAKDQIYRDYGTRRSFMYEVFHEGKVKVAELNATTHKGILALFSNPEIGDLTNLDTGREVIVSKDGANPPNYSVMPAMVTSKVEEEVLTGRANIRNEAAPKEDANALAAIAAILN